MLTFYLVRHGQAEHNVQKRLGGYGKYKLTQQGKRDAKRVGEHLTNVHFDAIICSDLPRTKETVQIIKKTIKSKKKIVTTKELREIHYGKYQYTKVDEIYKIFPDFKKNIHHVFERGESYHHMYLRVIHFVQELEKKYHDATILLVAHNGPIRAIKSYFHKWKYEEKTNIKIPHSYIGKFIISNKKLLHYHRLDENKEKRENKN